MPLYNKNFGKKGEEISAKYLQKKGLEILECNYYTRYGEIDLIVKDGNEIVFVEVKSRKSTKYGEPHEAITKFKQRNLIRTAQSYLKKHKLEEDDWRIDVIGVMFDNEDKPEINHIKNAVTYF